MTAARGYRMRRVSTRESAETRDPHVVSSVQLRCMKRYSVQRVEDTEETLPTSSSISSAEKTARRR